MKKIFAINMLLVYTLIYCVSTNAFAQENKTTANVYFIGLKGSRHIVSKGLLVDLIQDAQGFKMIMDGELKEKLHKRGYTLFKVLPGIHFFNVQVNNRNRNAKPVAINVAGGQTYFIQFAVDRGMASATVYCYQLSQSLGERIVAAIKAKLTGDQLIAEMALAVIKE